MKRVECTECGAELPVELGDLGINERDDGTIEILEINMHGAVQLASGESLADALRAAADAVEGGSR